MLEVPTTGTGTRTSLVFPAQVREFATTRGDNTSEGTNQQLLPLRFRFGVLYPHCFLAIQIRPGGIYRATWLTAGMRTKKCL